MPSLNVKEAAAVNRLVAVLAPHVTNGVVDEVARQFEFKKLPGSSKVKKLQWVIAELLEDGRSRTTAAKAITTLAIEAHHRTVAGNATMTISDADAIVAEMKVLGLATGELARDAWRVGLKSATVASAGSSPASNPRPSAPSTPGKPHRHDQALRYIAQLVADDANPQDRGRDLEKIIFGVLTVEELQPTANVVNPGEQIDLAFVLDGHYLVECKWRKEPIGLPEVAAFSTKVLRKAEGTFGLVVSMSGFVDNINETAARGARLNCVGMSHRELIAVLEGRTTLAAVVRAARAQASTRSTFYAP